MNILPYEIISLIYDNIGIDFINLKSTCTYLHNMDLGQQQKASCVLVKRLSKFINPTLFCQLLSKYDAYLSGSFPLLCVSNTIHGSTDIDIFFKSTRGIQNTFNPFDDFEIELATSLGLSDKDIHMYSNNIVPSNCSDATYENDIAFAHHMYKTVDNQTIKIDLIGLDIDPLSFIRDSFDLDGCQVFFDGSTFSHPTKNPFNFKDKQLSIIKLSNVFSQYTPLNSIHDSIREFNKTFKWDHIPLKYHIFKQYLNVSHFNNDLDIQHLKTVYNSMSVDHVIVPEYNLSINATTLLSIYSEQLDHNNNVRHHIGQDTNWLRVYRLLLRCLKYMSRGYTITNFEQYFQV